MAALQPGSLFYQFARGWRSYVLIALIALVSGFIGATRVPVTDIDEARFAQATRQMIESGDYVRIRLQDAERNRKPVGIYWLQAASVNVFIGADGKLNTIWPYRIPSMLGLMLAALATLWGGSILVGQRAAVIGAGLYAAGLLAGIEGMIAKTDSVMVGFTTLAIAALAHLRIRPERPRMLALVFWAALACGVMVKGPIPPLVAGLTLLALALWERKAAWMKPLLWWAGPALALLIVMPWALAIGAATEGRFFIEALGADMAPKLIGADHSHRAAPGYYLLLLPVLMFPATYAFPAAARVGWEALRAPRSDESHRALRFLIAWALPTLALLELMPTKLIHYALPTYPAFALMCGAGLMAMRGRQWRSAHPTGLVFFGVAGALIVALMGFVATLMPGDFGADARRAISTGLIGVLTIGAAITGLVMVRRPTTRAAVLVACALVLSFSLRERLLPEARAMFASNEAVAALTRARLLPRDNQPFWVVGYTQPSFIFLTRTSVRLASVDEIAAGAQAGDAAMIEGRVLHDVEDRLAARGLVFAQADEPVRAIAMGRGERVALSFGRIETAASDE
ncbi:MAG: ArnT family glycosyltransferase [Hyphomonadaceae bacterium]